MTDEQKLVEIQAVLDGLSMREVREICRERIIDEVFSMQTRTGTSGHIWRNFRRLMDTLGPGVAEIYKQEVQKYSTEVDPELWRIFTTGTAAEMEALAQRAQSGMNP